MTVLLATNTVKKVWGRKHLPAPFTNGSSEPVGEIWFDPPAEMPELLVKYLFTNDRLSMQVHPNDAQARHGARGKEECWYILDAEPGATLAIGLQQELTAGELEAAAIDGTIEQILVHYPISKGDFFYLPAGTIHAIGAGISLIEIQQNSDVTYRLFDYGRPRELHISDAIAVADRTPYKPKNFSRKSERRKTNLVDGPRFRVDEVAGAPNKDLQKRYNQRPALLIPLMGTYWIDGLEILPGQCAMRFLDSITFDDVGEALITQLL